MVSGFSILAHAWNTSCFGLYRLFISVAGSRSIVCGAFSGFCSLPPHPLLSTVYQCDGCLFFSGAWGLMAGLSGFASHRCSLHLGAGCQYWKLQDVSGTQPRKSDNVVYYCYYYYCYFTVVNQYYTLFFCEINALYN